MEGLYYPVFAGINTLEETESMTRDQLDLAVELSNKKFEWLSSIIKKGVIDAFNGNDKK